MSGTFAPIRAIEVEGTDIGKEIDRFVQYVEYESADGLADVGRIRLVNPNSYVSDAKIFKPGNEVSFFAGYSQSELKHIGRIKVVREIPNYPQDNEPTLTVVGYTKDSEMMDNEPGGKVGDKTSTDRTWVASSFSDAVEMVADRYGLEVDIDPTEATNKNVIQKVGVSDYDFVRGLANITGYYFWVDGDENGVWTLHFKRSDSSQADLGQEKIYTFRYNWEDEGSLLSFTPELLIKGAKTKLAVTVKDRRSGKVLLAEFEEENDAAPDTAAAGDLTGQVQGEFTTASDIKLFINDYSFEVVSNRKFTTEAEITDWAQQWFRRMRENFIMSRGVTIGNETLAARQIHKIEGISQAYEGEYFFSKVKHVLDDGQGYKCMFGARKVVP